MDRRVLGIVIGVALAVLVGSGIFFEPNEPRPLQVFLATILGNALTGLLLAAVLDGTEKWRATLLVGFVLGGLMGLSVVLAKSLESAPYALPATAVVGLIIAAVLKRFARQRTS